MSHASLLAWSYRHWPTAERMAAAGAADSPIALPSDRGARPSLPADASGSRPGSAPFLQGGPYPSSVPLPKTPDKRAHGSGLGWFVADLTDLCIQRDGHALACPAGFAPTRLTGDGGSVVSCLFANPDGPRSRTPG